MILINLILIKRKVCKVHTCADTIHGRGEFKSGESMISSIQGRTIKDTVRKIKDMIKGKEEKQMKEKRKRKEET